MAWQYAALAGFQIISGLQQAEMVGMQAEIQKQIDDFNAEMADLDAWKAVGYGQTQMARYQSQLDQAQAGARVSAAGAGVKLEGSLGEIAAEQELIGLANMLDIENQARERALGYTRQARGIRFGSEMSQGMAKTQQAAIIGGALLNAAATGVSATKGKSFSFGSESGYDVPNKGSESLSMNTNPSSYITGTSQGLASSGYLLPF